MNTCNTVAGHQTPVSSAAASHPFHDKGTEKGEESKLREGEPSGQPRFQVVCTAKALVLGHIINKQDHSLLAAASNFFLNRTECHYSTQNLGWQKQQR